MRLIHQILQDIKNSSGTNNKIDVLRDHKDNRLLLQYLKAVYDPSINYYVVAYKDGLQTVIEPYDEEVSTILDFVHALSERILTGSAALEALTGFTTTLSTEARQLLRLLINRDIQSSVGPATLNKALGFNFIHIEPYMRCSLEKDVKQPLEEWQDGYISQLKADGMYASQDLHPEHAAITSRSGLSFQRSKPFQDIIDFAQTKGNIDIFNGVKLHDCTLEGEMIIFKDGVLLPREESNGMLNRFNQSGEPLPDNCVIQYVVWDIVPTALRVYKGRVHAPYSERFQIIQDLFRDTTGLISAIETIFTKDLEEARQHFLSILGRGLEGTVVKHPNAIWMDGDNPQQIKMKIEAPCDLEVVKFKEADPTSKNASTFGSIIMKSSDGLLEVAITGFTDAKRAEIWAARDWYIGKIFGVKFNSIMKPKKAGDLHSLFLPRFDGVRLDKFEADSLQRVFAQFEDAKGKKTILEQHPVVAPAVTHDIISTTNNIF